MSWVESRTQIRNCTINVLVHLMLEHHSCDPSVSIYLIKPSSEVELEASRQSVGTKSEFQRQLRVLCAAGEGEQQGWITGQGTK